MGEFRFDEIGYGKLLQVLRRVRYFENSVEVKLLYQVRVGQNLGYYFVNQEVGFLILGY